jgi:HPr kinase/phosphorylase
MDPIHATAIAYEGMGCLIIGASGAGKSQLAADAFFHGAKLVADDRVLLRNVDGFLVAEPLPQGAGVIELRHLGLIRLAAHQRLPSHAIHLVVELGGEGAERLPEHQLRRFCGVDVRFLALPAAPMTRATALLLYLKAMQERRVLSTDWMPARIVGE